MNWRAHIARHGEGWFPGDPWVKQCSICLFLLAAVLRFWGLPDLPFTHDELSALMRIYPTLGETIQRGVIELDTHPPGVQVFEWAWTKLFGASEAAVKTPFIVLALLALFAFYRFALAWTSAPTALIGTALLATLQYTVLYAQIARPYAVGFFTIALLADQLTRYLAFSSRRSLVGIGVAAALSAYTHHFSLLLAAIMVVSVWPLLKAHERKPYIIACAIAALSYVPVLPIFAKQLGIGGLGGWLPPPDAEWLPGYFRWILHFSPTLMVCTGLVVVSSVILAFWKKLDADPARWLLPLWGLAPLVIGYGYSVWRAPVLQYSLVLFNFPFLLFWAFIGLKHLGRTATLSVTIALALVSTVTLYSERKHALIFSDTPYAAMVRVAGRTIHEHGADNVLVLFDAPRPQVEFHALRHGLDTLTHILWARDDANGAALFAALADPRWRYVVLGTTNGGIEERIAQVQGAFPYITHIENHVEGQVRVLARSPKPVIITERWPLAEVSPARRQGLVEVDPTLPMQHTARTRTSAWDLHQVGHGIGLRHQVAVGTFDAQDIFEAEMQVTGTKGTASPLLVFELLQGDSTVIWRATPSFLMPDTAVIAAAFSPSWIKGFRGSFSLHAYVDDPAKGPIQVHRIRLYRRTYDPVRNALFAPITSLGHFPQ